MGEERGWGVREKRRLLPRTALESYGPSPLTSVVQKHVIKEGGKNVERGSKGGSTQGT